MSDLDIHMNDDTARRVYGVLATSLNEALVEMRQALDPHAVLLPKGRIGDVDALLAEFARRRVRIALYGEVKAGQVDAAQRPGRRRAVAGRLRSADLDSGAHHLRQPDGLAGRRTPAGQRRRAHAAHARRRARRRRGGDRDRRRPAAARRAGRPARYARRRQRRAFRCDQCRRAALARRRRPGRALPGPLHPGHAPA